MKLFNPKKRKEFVESLKGWIPKSKDEAIALLDFASILNSKSTLNNMKKVAYKYLEEVCAGKDGPCAVHESSTGVEVKRVQNVSVKYDDTDEKRQIREDIATANEQIEQLMKKFEKSAIGKKIGSIKAEIAELEENIKKIEVVQEIDKEFEEVKSPVYYKVTKF